MNHLAKTWVTVLAMSLGVVPTARAQSGTWEFGLDVEAEARWKDAHVPVSPFFAEAIVRQKYFNVELPSSRVRLGYWISDVVQIEPSLGFAFSVASEDEDQLVASTSSVSLAVYRSLRPSPTGPFVGLGILMRHSMGSDPNDVDIRAGVPVTLGARLGMGGVALRVTTSGIWWVDREQGYWGLDVGVGLSAFSRRAGGDS